MDIHPSLKFFCAQTGLAFNQCQSATALPERTFARSVYLKLASLYATGSVTVFSWWCDFDCISICSQIIALGPLGGCENVQVFCTWQISIDKMSGVPSIIRRWYGHSACARLMFVCPSEAIFI